MKAFSAIVLSLILSSTAAHAAHAANLDKPLEVTNAALARQISTALCDPKPDTLHKVNHVAGLGCTYVKEGSKKYYTATFRSGDWVMEGGHTDMKAVLKSLNPTKAKQLFDALNVQGLRQVERGWTSFEKRIQINDNNMLICKIHDPTAGGRPPGRVEVPICIVRAATKVIRPMRGRGGPQADATIQNALPADIAPGAAQQGVGTAL